MKVITIMVSLFLIVILLSVYIYLENTAAERLNEMADLQGMRGAELTAMMTWGNKLPEAANEYWYDPDEFELIPVDKLKPNAFGLGRKAKGGAYDDFSTDTGSWYKYDESVDYTNKVIHVTVRNNDGNLDVKVDWVDAE